jgi:hypothetical protein
MVADGALDLAQAPLRLQAIVCPNSPVPAGAPQTTLRKGISRVH